MTEQEPLFDPRWALDDLWDLWEITEAEIAAGVPVTDAYRAALADEIERREGAELFVVETGEP